MSISAPPAESRPYTPYGAAGQLFYARAAEVLLAGPAGTGKSRACLEKLHLAAMKYPGMRGLIVRKTRESLSESGLVTFEDKVLPEQSRLKEGPPPERAAGVPLPEWLGAGGRRARQG